jgi:hypothetical protein
LPGFFFFFLFLVRFPVFLVRVEIFVKLFVINGFVVFVVDVGMCPEAGRLIGVHGIVLEMLRYSEAAGLAGVLAAAVAEAATAGAAAAAGGVAAAGVGAAAPGWVV